LPQGQRARKGKVQETKLSIFVLDQRKRPVMPCSEKRARLLVERGRAVVHRRYPFTIRLKNQVAGDVELVRVKLDPGGRTTSIAVVADENGNKPAKVFELIHRGRQISEALSRLGIPKTHAFYAACVGEVGALVGWPQPTLAIKARAKEDYCRTKLTVHGFPRGSWTRTKSVRGFHTGDMVRAEVPTCKQAGNHIGRVAVRGSGSLRVANTDAINATSCKLSQSRGRPLLRRQSALPPRPEERGLKRGRL
jgi:hypothetical protein